MIFYLNRPLFSDKQILIMLACTIFYRNEIRLIRLIKMHGGMLKGG